MREAPRYSYGRAARRIYRVRRSAGALSTTYAFEIIERQIVTVENHKGWFVRYDHGLQQLHDAQDLPALIETIRGEGNRATLDNKPFEPRKSDWLPFILEWEKGVGSY